MSSPTSKQETSVQSWDGSSRVLEALCVTKQFQTTNVIFAQYLANNGNGLCSKIDFNQRWSIRTLEADEGFQVINEKEIVSGGLHAIAYQLNQLEGNTLHWLIAFRHQEKEGLFDDEMWEAMGLFGRNFVQMETGVAAPGSMASLLSSGLQYSIHYTRRYLQMDFHYHASKIVDALLTRYRTEKSVPTMVYFTGYSLGGTVAQLQAFRNPETSRAIVFASPGVTDIVLDLYGERYFPTVKASQVMNVIDSRDKIPSLDCQYGVICASMDPQANGLAPTAIHERFVYGDGAENFVSQAPAIPNANYCELGSTWSDSHGFCSGKSELKQLELRDVGVDCCIFLALLLIVLLFKHCVKLILVSSKTLKEATKEE